MQNMLSPQMIKFIVFQKKAIVVNFRILLVLVGNQAILGYHLIIQTCFYQVLIVPLIIINMETYKIFTITLILFSLFTKVTTLSCGYGYFWHNYGGYNHCHACSCSNDCTSQYSCCNPPNIVTGSQSNVCTPCSQGTYASTRVCNNCPPQCSKCTSGTVCQSCNSPYVLSGTSCIPCSSGTYESGGTCVGCPSQCSNCTSPAVCQLCNSPYVLSGTSCIPCSSGTYESGGSCVSCPSQCSNCTSPAVCQSCNSPYVLSGTSCIPCSSGTYESGGSCVSCPSQCSNCTSPAVCQSCNSPYVLSGTSCIPCSSGTYESGGSCVSCPSQCSNCTNPTVCQSCSQFYQLQHQFCYDICGDSVVIQFPCDNEIDIRYDGCTDQCSIETDFFCQIDINRSICSYEKQLQISLTYLQKIGTNRASVSYKISPPLNVFNKIDILQVFSFNVSNFKIESINWNKEKSEIEVVLLFENSIQDLPYRLSFTPSTTIHQEFFKTPVSTFDSKIDFGRYYGGEELGIDHDKIRLFESLVIVCVGLGWLTWILGIFSDRLGGIETIVLLQYVWITHVWNVKPATLPYSSLALLRFSSGYNHLFSSSKYQIQLPRAYLSDISTTYFYNDFNLMILLNVLPLLPMIFFKIYRRYVSKEKWDQIIEQRYQKSQELLMYSIITTLQTFCSNSVIYFKFGEQDSIQSLVLFSCVYVLNLFVFIKFFLSSASFLRFRFSFQLRFFKIFLIYVLIIVSNILLMGLLPTIIWAPIIPSGLLLVYTIILRPYKERTDNARAIFTFLVMTFVSSLELIIQYIDPSEQLLNTLLIILIVLMYLVQVIALIQAIYFIHYNRKIARQRQLMERGQGQTAEQQQKQLNEMMRKYQLEYFVKHITGQDREEMIKELYKNKKVDDNSYELDYLGSQSEKNDEVLMESKKAKRKPFVLPKTNIMAPFCKFWGIQGTESVKQKNIRQPIIEEVELESKGENLKTDDKTGKQTDKIKERKRIKELMKQEKLFVNIKMAQKYKGVVDKSILIEYKQI